MFEKCFIIHIITFTIPYHFRWIFYENVDYDPASAGRALISRGTDYCADLDPENTNIVSNSSMK